MYDTQLRFRRRKFTLDYTEMNTRFWLTEGKDEHKMITTTTFKSDVPTAI